MGRRLVLAFCLIALGAILTTGQVAAQDDAASMLPAAAVLGEGWVELSVETPDEVPDSFRDAATGIYGGPGGSRAIVTVFLADSGLKAVRDSWENANSAFYPMQSMLTSEYEPETQTAMEAKPLPAGCVDGQRATGADYAMGTAFPAGATLCAADPDRFILAFVSGELDGTTGYDASDRLVETVLSVEPGATPVP